MKILIKLDRFFAWILFGSMLLYFISGYGMVKGIIDSSLATKLHMSILTYLILTAFTFHTCYAIHLALRRWQIWNLASKIVLFSFFILFLGSFIYIDRYYTVSNKNQDTPVKPSASSNSSLLSPTPSTTEKTFTLEELAKYNGQNGNPAYVAVSGKVYDLSSVFNSGSHYSHYAGKELTTAFFSRHVESEITKYPLVGKLAN